MKAVCAVTGAAMTAMTGMPSRASLTAAATSPRHTMPLIDPSLLPLLPSNYSQLRAVSHVVGLCQRPSFPPCNSWFPVPSP